MLTAPPFVDSATMVTDVSEDKSQLIKIYKWMIAHVAAIQIQFPQDGGLLR